MALHAERGIYIDMNDVGGRIWNMLEQPQTVAAVCQALVAYYEVDPRECEAETLAFLEGIFKEGLIRRE